MNRCFKQNSSAILTPVSYKKIYSKQALGALTVARKHEIPTISEAAGVRYLHFGTEWVQGAMWVEQPAELVLEYTAQLMAWLLLVIRLAVAWKCLVSLCSYYVARWRVMRVIQT